MKIESWLLDADILNTKDMTFIGNEKWSLSEHLLNIWHWDAAIGLLCFASIPLTAFGILLLTQFSVGKKANWT